MFDFFLSWISRETEKIENLTDDDTPLSKLIDNSYRTIANEYHGLSADKYFLFRKRI